ncbi:MAG: hypothetical protein JSS65_10910 [Armatimonadetes bacterium]|nr:hypothetical protein [Armatimonadota bacterium]
MIDAVPVSLSANEQAENAWAAVWRVIAELEGVSVEEKKSCLHVCAGGGAFLGVHPRKNGVRLNIVLDRTLEGPRVARSEAVSKRRFHNEVDLAAGDQVDGELAGWISEAHRFRISG